MNIPLQGFEWLALNDTASSVVVEVNDAPPLDMEPASQDPSSLELEGFQVIE